MKAVMYGGGNIGRGFIGMLFSMSGYEVTFIDVAEPVIEGLNREKKYPVRIVSSEGHEDIEVTNVCAVNGKIRKRPQKQLRKQILWPQRWASMCSNILSPIWQQESGRECRGRRSAEHNYL